MPKPPFWVFNLAGFLFFSFSLSSFFFFFSFSFFFFFFYVFHLLIEWTFGDRLPSLFFSAKVILMHLHLSILDESFPFLMNSLLDESCIPLSIMNFGLFKFDAYFFFLYLTLMEFHLSFLDWVKPYFSLMISYLWLNEFSTCLSCLLRELFQLVSKLQGQLLLNMRFKHAYLDFSHPRFRF